jgi:hypothetical protein
MKIDRRPVVAHDQHQDELGLRVMENVVDLGGRNDLDRERRARLAVRAAESSILSGTTREKGLADAGQADEVAERIRFGYTKGFPEQV